MNTYDINYFTSKDFEEDGHKLNGGFHCDVTEGWSLSAVKKFINDYATYEDGTPGREEYLALKEVAAEEPDGRIQVRAYRLNPESWEIHTYIETSDSTEDYSFVFTPEKTN